MAAETSFPDAPGTTPAPLPADAPREASLSKSIAASGPAEAEDPGWLKRSQELFRAGQFEAALEACGETCRQETECPQRLKARGHVLAVMGRLDEAVECYRAALQIHPENSGCHLSLGCVLLTQGKYEEAWPEYEWRWKLPGRKIPDVQAPRWDGSPLAGRTILLHAEQGLGDTLHFIRYAPLLREQGATVLFHCPTSLVPLISSCQGIDCIIPFGDALPECDFFAPLIDVPAIMGHTPENAPANKPYLFAQQQRVAHWQRQLALYDGLKVGIAWQGNPKHAMDGFRSFPLRHFAPLAEIEGVQLFSLQRGPGTVQIEVERDRLGLIDIGRRTDQQGGAFLDTAAVLKNLDLLICCDSATAHLAGGLGVPTWLALAHMPDWRWGMEGETTPWYRSMRLFRQAEMGDWEGVFARMAAALRERVATEPQPAYRGERILTGSINCLNRSRHGVMLYNRHDAYIGRSHDRYGEFSEGEVELFEQVLRPGDLVVDAGANIGSHTVPMARRVRSGGRVYAFEPQRLVFQNLCANVALNNLTNVLCRPEAVGAEPGSLLVPQLDPQTPTNFGGLSLEDCPRGERVPVVTIDGLELPRCRLIKADVEGMEAAVIRGARETIERCRPILYLENDRPDRADDLVGLVASLGYRLYRHAPRLFNPKNHFGNRENIFGNIRSANILAVHESMQCDITGLREIPPQEPKWEG